MSLDDFRNDVMQGGSKSERADFFKLKEGDNKVVILTNPIGYSQAFINRKGFIAYEGAPYNKYTSRKYKCYIKDLSDGVIKVADFSYTVSKKIIALADGARTKFDGFPMPYVINFKTEHAGTKEVNTECLADEDYLLSDEDIATISAFDKIEDIIDRIKASTKKKVENDPETMDAINNFIAKKVKEEEDKKKKKDEPELPVIEYPENEYDDVPFSN